MRAGAAVKCRKADGVETFRGTGTQGSRGAATPG